MIAAAHNDQGKTWAASGDSLCGMGMPAPIAGRHKFQSRTADLPRLRQTRPGPHCLGHFPRVGWMYRSADEYLTFTALTRAGIKPDHAVALLSFQSLPNQSACEAAVGPEVHSSVPSKGLSDADHRDREAKRSVPIMQGEFPNDRGAFQRECC